MTLLCIHGVVFTPPRSGTLCMDVATHMTGEVSLMRDEAGQVCREHTSHNVSGNAKESVSGTPQSGTFILVTGLLGGLLQHLEKARQRIVRVRVQAGDEVSRSAHFHKSDGSHVVRQRDEATSFKSSCCSPDFVRLKS